MAEFVTLVYGYSNYLGQDTTKLLAVVNDEGQTELNKRLNLSRYNLLPTEKIYTTRMKLNDLHLLPSAHEPLDFVDV